MAGSSIGEYFKIMTWGESHGEALGVVIDGCPAGLSLEALDIQKMLDRRKPGQTDYSTKRVESDSVEILSGVFEGVTTGTPISLMVRNTSQRSKDYSNISKVYRPGHADYSFIEKYGIRDYRGGGRSSGRETIGRVAAGAVAKKLLSKMGVEVVAYTKSIGNISLEDTDERYTLDQIEKSPIRMPDEAKSKEATEYLNKLIENKDSAGGIIECKAYGMPAGIGEPVFGKLDAMLSAAVMSIGAVKGVEIGAGFAASRMVGSQNNDEFVMDGTKVAKKTNNAGGILGGISDGDTIVVRAAIKPTPSIFREQNTVNEDKENTKISITGRHDPVIVPRAVVVVEAMVALTLIDRIFAGMNSRLDRIVDILQSE